MREYTFLLKSGFRTEHFKCHTLRQAIIKAKLKYGQSLSGAVKYPSGEFIWQGQYQTCGENAFVMSGWLACDYETERAVR